MPHDPYRALYLHLPFCCLLYTSVPALPLVARRLFTQAAGFAPGDDE